MTETKLETLAKLVEAGGHPSDTCFEIADMKIHPKIQGACYDALQNNSIDAVEKLRAELLPRSNWGLDHCVQYVVTLGVVSKEDVVFVFFGSAKTEAAARLAALLRALDKEA